MEYIFILGLLLLLAAFDLVVGVSNDAVNFLNSAFGSKAANLKAIMIVASIGIAIGAIFSSGMMDIARFGIVNPDKFYFEEMMYLFAAVVLTDVILIDFFNTLGLPTSTTVSMVFELLGAGVAVAMMKLITTDSALTAYSVFQFINTQKATEVIVAIFSSVGVAFILGTIVQYISRLIFTFEYEKNTKYLIGIFGGISFSALSYFLIIKGLKNVSFIPKDFIKWVGENSKLILLIFFVAFTILSQVLHMLKISVFRIIILTGTFSLAMAFAGNDLVNFVGVSVAAWDSYHIWNDSGNPQNSLLMSGLRENAPASQIFLVISGFIMVLTLWFSKKAKNIIQTEVGLSSQDSERKEKFRANALSRAVVRMAIVTSNVFDKIIPKKISKAIDVRFLQPENVNGDEKPAFDLIRACVNLVVSSSIISLGTSLTLPLSTTYVTFTTAMGSSLADRAWGRDSAVFRVAGVFNVIGSWFLTAIAAFTMTFAIASLFYFGKFYALIPITALATFVFYKSNFSDSEKEEFKIEDVKSAIDGNKIFGNDELASIKQIIGVSSQSIVKAVNKIDRLYRENIDGLDKENRASLRETKKSAKKLSEDISELKSGTYYLIKSLDESSSEAIKFYILALDYLRNMSQSMYFISENSYEHTNNNHKKLKGSQLKDLKDISKNIEEQFEKISQLFEVSMYSNSITLLIEEQNKIKSNISLLIDKQIKDIRLSDSGPKNTNLYFGILLETKVLVSYTINLMFLFKNFKDQYKNIDPFKE